MDGQLDSDRASDVVTAIELAGLKHIKSGKVRELYESGENLLLVATDRVSAFDCILPNGIPGKGRLLTSISAFWFDFFHDLVPNHLIAWRGADFSPALDAWRSVLDGRSMEVRKTSPLPIECVVRGYLAGSGWKEYQKSGKVCGVALPAGLTNGDRLPEPVFTPATKAESGHDENISFEQAASMVDRELLEKVRDLSLEIFRRAHDFMLQRGLILADTKFEFGLYEGELMLIDEVLTPDSSRFWARHCHMPGAPFQYGFDKQIVRNYLETLDWDKTPPAPPLPDDLVQQVAEAYDFIHQILTRPV